LTGTIHKPIKNKIMHKTGTNPGKGTYKCRKCGKEIKLEDDIKTLPECPVCGHDEWDKIS